MAVTVFVEKCSEHILRNKPWFKNPWRHLINKINVEDDSYFIVVGDNCSTGLPNIGCDFRDDWMELKLSVIIYAGFPVNCQLVSFFHELAIERLYSVSN